MKIGTQVAYLPTHADGDVTHPDVEFGFVTSARGEAHFCRYWRKGQPGVLRTVANSELTPNSNLIEYGSVPQAMVDQWIEQEYSKIMDAVMSRIMPTSNGGNNGCKTV